MAGIRRARSCQPAVWNAGGLPCWSTYMITPLNPCSTVSSACSCIVCGSGCIHARTRSHGTKYREMAVPTTRTIRMMRFAFFRPVVLRSFFVISEYVLIGGAWRRSHRCSHLICVWCHRGRLLIGPDGGWRHAGGRCSPRRSQGPTGPECSKDQFSRQFNEYALLGSAEIGGCYLSKISGFDQIERYSFFFHALYVPEEVGRTMAGR